MAHHFSHDGVRIAYDDTGAGDPAIVFVHGWCCDRTHHAAQVAYFSQSHRCISLDLRGHGDSDVPDAGYGIPVFADDVAALCGALGLRKPVIVGHSMGGAIALSLAARHPDLPSRIVLLDAAICPPDALTAMVGPLADAFAGDGWRDALGGIFTGMFIESEDASLRERIVAAALATPQHVAAGEWTALWANDAAADGAACCVPVLYVGSHAPVADLAKVRAALPAVVIDQTPGVGHFHQIIAPEQINAMIERFLAAD